MYLFIIDCANPGSYEGGAAFVDDERISFEKNADHLNSAPPFNKYAMD